MIKPKYELVVRDFYGDFTSFSREYITSAPNSIQVKVDPAHELENVFPTSHKHLFMGKVYTFSFYLFSQINVLT